MSDCMDGMLCGLGAPQNSERLTLPLAPVDKTKGFNFRELFSSPEPTPEQRSLEEANRQMFRQWMDLLATLPEAPSGMEWIPVLEYGDLHTEFNEPNSYTVVETITIRARLREV